MRLPDGLAGTAQRQDWLLTAAQLRRGGIAPSQVARMVRQDRWWRVRGGVYLVEPERAEKIMSWVEARAMVLRYPGAVVAGASAARLWQLRQVPAGPPEMVVRPRAALAARADLRPRQWQLDAADVEVIRGMPVTSVARTLADLACTHDRLDVLPILDAALRLGRVTRDDLVAIGAGVAGRPGGAHVADLWALADGRAESALESKVRLRCIDGAVAPEELQLQVRDRTERVVARADMAVRRRTRGPGGWVLIEADGADVHSAPEALFRDRRRANEVSSLGHVMLRFTVLDVLDAFTVPRAVRAAV